LKKNFGENYLMTPFLAKNQIGLFFDSESKFKRDEMDKKGCQK
jgi:hypothetical protein